MVDQEKLRLMTKAEMIKRQNRRELFTRRTFYNSDFIAFGVIKSFVGATLAYVLLVGIIFLSQADEVLVEINLSGLISLGFNYINVYALILIAVIPLAFLQHLKIYHRNGRAVREYRNIIRALNKKYNSDDYE